MKFIDRFIYTIFSLLILVVAIVLGMYSLDILKLDAITDTLKIIKDNMWISIAVVAVFMILALKGIFFKSVVKKEKNSDGILLKNENGKLVISRETIENIVNGVAKGFESTQNVSTRLSVINNSISVFVNLQVVGDVSIAELSANLQNKIKSTVKKVTNLELSEVNIRVKNISDITSKNVAKKEEKIEKVDKKEKIEEQVQKIEHNNVEE